MITLTIDDREVRDALTELQRRLRDMTPAMRAIATELEARVDKRFETQTDPNGARWKPLADSTLLSAMRGGVKKGQSLTKKGGGTRSGAIRALARKQILIDHGDMLGSLSSRFDANSAEVGFGQPYAAYHEYGTKRMPRRGLLLADPEAGTLGEGDRRAVLDIIRAYLADAGR